jgi:hypothetical protein
LTREKSREFNKEDWSISNNINNKLSKYEMIDDLIDSEILLNKDSTKVKNILGFQILKFSTKKLDLQCWYRWRIWICRSLFGNIFS